MYICQECGYEFAEPAIHYEYYREETGVQKMAYKVCPHCYCPQYDEAIYCEGKGCGRPISPTAPYHLCHDCTAQAKQRFVDMLRDNFTAGEIALLNDTYEGEYFEI